MLKRLKDETLKEISNSKRPWDFFAFAAVPDSWLGWPELKWLRERVKLYVISSDKNECLEMCEEPFRVLDDYPSGELLSLHSDPADFERIQRWGYCCGYILAMPIRDHWFSVSIVLSRTKRRMTLTDHCWLQGLHIRHQLYADRINPAQRGLLRQRERQLLRMISEEKSDKEIMPTLYNKTKKNKRGIKDNAYNALLKNTFAALEGAPEARRQGIVARQIGLLGVAAKYGLIQADLRKLQGRKLP